MIQIDRRVAAAGWAMCVLTLIVGCVQSQPVPVIPPHDAIAVGHTDPLPRPQLAAQLASFLQRHSRGWQTMWHTHPSPQHSVSFYREGQHTFTLFIGENWLSDGEHIRTLDVEEKNELMEILGLGGSKSSDWSVSW